jgi:hypothetical protein
MPHASDNFTVFPSEHFCGPPTVQQQWMNALCSPANTNKVCSASCHRPRIFLRRHHHFLSSARSKATLIRHQKRTRRCGQSISISSRAAVKLRVVFIEFWEFRFETNQVHRKLAALRNIMARSKRLAYVGSSSLWRHCHYNVVWREALAANNVLPLMLLHKANQSDHRLMHGCIKNNQQ